jgi:hypothetical protein
MAKELEIKMSNIENEAVDLLHQVVSFKGTTWENPFPRSKSYTEHYFNYKKYKNFLANSLFLEIEPMASEYKELKKNLIEKGKLTLECTCYPNPCHMDAIRERLTQDLEALGFTIKTNQGPIVIRSKTELEEEN